MSIGKVINSSAFQGLQGLGASKKEVGGLEEAEGKNALDAFGEMLTEGVGKVNKAVTDYEKISKDFANGEKVNVHEMMIKGEQADMSLKLMLTLRNKIVEAYQEVMRLPV